jgi:hypothetical protein
MPIVAVADERDTGIGIVAWDTGPSWIAGLIV